MLSVVVMPLFGKTSPEEMVLEIVYIVLIAFIPSIIYMIVLRYVEKYDREPWGSMFTVFLWGATMGVVVVIIFRGMFYVHFGDYYPDLASDRKFTQLIAAVLITPIVAELIKPAGLLFVRYDIEESEDGLIYGAVSGLGYAATENLLFGIFLVSIYGMDFYINIVIIRSISVVLLNASASALTGYGVSRARAIKHKTGTLWAFPLFLLTAIAMHGFFNFLMISGLGMQDIYSVSSSLVFAIMLSIIFMTWIYSKIYRLDRLDDKEPEPDHERIPRHRQAHPRPHPGGGHPDYYARGTGPPPGRPRYPDEYYSQPGHRRPGEGPHGGPVHRAPPRAVRVGPAPGADPPPPEYAEQSTMPKATKIMDAEWSVPGKRQRIRHKERAAPEPEPEPEPELDWEDIPEDEKGGIDWEDAQEEPKKVKKPPARKKKGPAKVQWAEEEEEEEWRFEDD